MRTINLSILVLALTAACANTDGSLHSLKSAGGGPDEFAVIPQLPLQVPDTTTLPVPTPGGSNLADPSPEAAAIAALGGSARGQVAGGVPAGDAAIVAQASRYGVAPGIRAELSAADTAFRARRTRLNVFNPLGRDRYFSAYAGQSLDAFAELTRLRGLGIAVPTPPEARSSEAIGRSSRVRQNCVFTTAGPGNQLRRVCTLVTSDDE